MIRPSSTIVRGLAVLVCGLLSACSDEGPTAVIQPLDPVRAAALLPSVEDAAVRLTSGIVDPTVAGNLTDILSALERDLEANDGTHARQHLESAWRMLDDYVDQGPKADAPDVSAIRLMLIHVSSLLDAS